MLKRFALIALICTALAVTFTSSLHAAGNPTNITFSIQAPSTLADVSRIDLVVKKVSDGSVVLTATRLPADASTDASGNYVLALASVMGASTPSGNYTVEVTVHSKDNIDVTDTRSSGFYGWTKPVLLGSVSVN